MLRCSMDNITTVKVMCTYILQVHITVNVPFYTPAVSQDISWHNKRKVNSALICVATRKIK